MMSRLFCFRQPTSIMAIQVKFFASLKEDIPDALREVPASDASTVADVWVAATQINDIPAHIVCSVNHSHEQIDFPVKDGDEVAFFPPITGG